MRLNPDTQRVDYASYLNKVSGVSVAMAGRFPDDECREKFITTDAATLNIVADARLLKDEQGLPFTGFVEVIGIKVDDSELRACEIRKLGDAMDVGLWNDAFQRTQCQAFRSMFTPVPGVYMLVGDRAYQQADTETLIPVTIRIVLDSIEQYKNNQSHSGGNHLFVLPNGKQLGRLVVVAWGESVASQGMHKVFHANDLSGQINVRDLSQSEQKGR